VMAMQNGSGPRVVRCRDGEPGVCKIEVRRRNTIVVYALDQIETHLDLLVSANELKGEDRGRLRTRILRHFP